MEQMHREALRKNWIYLLENIIPDELLDHMVEQSVITSDMYEEVRCQHTRKEQITQFLFTLQRRGPHAFGKFLHSLRNTEQGYIADKLQNSLPVHHQHQQPMQL